MSTHDELLGKNKCPCLDCRAFRKRRGRMGARVANSNPANDPRRNGAKGAEGLLNRFRKEVQAQADRQGIVLNARQLERRAMMRRDNHLSRIAMDRHRNEKAS